MAHAQTPCPAAEPRPSTSSASQRSRAAAARVRPYVVAAPRDRDAILPAGDRARVYRPQGWLPPVLLIDGQMAGVWSHERNGDRLVVQVEPFARLTRAAHAGVEAEAQALAGFLGGELELGVVSR